METSLFLFMPSGGELFIIIFAMLLLFGGKKIPELMRGLGRGIREFNDARDSVKSSLEEEMRRVDREREEQRRLERERAAEQSRISQDTE